MPSSPSAERIDNCARNTIRAAFALVASTPEAVVNATCRPSLFELGLKLLQQVFREIGSSYVKADLVQTIIRRAGLGAPIHAADDDMVLVPCQKLGMELGVADPDQVNETVKSFPIFCDMSTLCGTGVAGKVYSDGHP